MACTQRAAATQHLHMRGTAPAARTGLPLPQGPAAAGALAVEALTPPGCTSSPTITFARQLNEAESNLLLTGGTDGSVRVWRAYLNPGLQRLATAWQAVPMRAPGPLLRQGAAYALTEYPSLLYACGGCQPDVLQVSVCVCGVHAAYAVCARCQGAARGRAAGSARGRGARRRGPAPPSDPRCRARAAGAPAAPGVGPGQRGGAAAGAHPAAAQRAAAPRTRQRARVPPAVGGGARPAAAGGGLLRRPRAAV
jgi:hypothetical protein